VRHRITIFTFVVLMIAVAAYGQSPLGHLGLSGCLSLPVGDFGKNSGDNGGLAKTGFGLCADFFCPIASSGVVWVTSGSALYNSLDISTFEEEFGDDDVDIDGGHWLNVPVMTGLGVVGKVAPQLELYTMFQFGIDFVKGPDIKITAPEGMVKFSTGSATAYGFSIGGGMIINKRFNIGIRYYSFGEPEFNFEISGTGMSPIYQNAKQSISIVTVTAGIYF